MKGKLGKLGLVVGVLAVAAGAAATRGPAGTQNEVVLAMLSPLTGPLAFVGVDNRQGAEAAVRAINAAGGIRGRQVRLEFYDDGSNPSQGVVHMNRIGSDQSYVGVIGSGFSSVGLAVAPIVGAQKVPYISMASSAAQVTPAKPYYYMTTATSRLFAYSMAFELRKRGIRRIALMADNGGFGREGVANVKQLANRFGLQVVEEIIFPLTQTSFTADLTRVKNSNAQALWVWNATTLAVTITKEYKQLGLSQRLVLTGGNASVQYLQPACPDANGALINTYLANVASFLPRSNPARPVALRVNGLLRKSGSTFNFDGYTAVYMFKRAIELGGFTREGINNALESRMKGFVGPGGRYYYSNLNHSGLGLKSMVVSQVASCRLRPVAGQAVLKG